MFQALKRARGLGARNALYGKFGTKPFQALKRVRGLGAVAKPIWHLRHHAQFQALKRERGQLAL